MHLQDPAAEMEEMGFGPVRLVDSIAVYMAGSRRRLNTYVFVKDGERTPRYDPGASASDDEDEKENSGASSGRKSEGKGVVASPSLSEMKPFQTGDVLAELSRQSSQKVAAKSGDESAASARDVGGVKDQQDVGAADGEAGAGPREVAGAGVRRSGRTARGRAVVTEQAQEGPSTQEQGSEEGAAVEAAAPAPAKQGTGKSAKGGRSKAEVKEETPAGASSGRQGAYGLRAAPRRKAV